MSDLSLFVGDVVHTRFAPRSHRLRYRIFQLLVDLDEVGAAASRLRLLSRDRFNLFSLYRCDHGQGQGPRGFALESLAAAGLTFAPGRIRLLAMPRVLGFVFNPLSVYFCDDAAGRLSALIYEVHNTFGERHAYVVPIPDDPRAGGAPVIRQASAKTFHVSPFMGMEMSYRFAVRPPDETVSVIVEGLAGAGSDQGREGERLIFASFAGVRRQVTDAELLRQFLFLPLLTLKVVGAIHLEALRLWLKGLRLFPSPPAPGGPVTLGHPLDEDPAVSAP